LSFGFSQRASESSSSCPLHFPLWQAFFVVRDVKKITYLMAGALIFVSEVIK